MGKKNKAKADEQLCGVEVARPTGCSTSGSCPDRRASIALSAIMSAINHKRS